MPNGNKARPHHSRRRKAAWVRLIGKGRGYFFYKGGNGPVHARLPCFERLFPAPPKGPPYYQPGSFGPTQRKIVRRHRRPPRQRMVGRKHLDLWPFPRPGNSTHEGAFQTPPEVAPKGPSGKLQEFCRGQLRAAKKKKPHARGNGRICGGPALIL